MGAQYGGNIDPGFKRLEGIGGGRNIDPGFKRLEGVGGGRNIDPGFKRLEDINIEGIEKVGGGDSEIIEKIKYLINEHGLSREEALEMVIQKFRKPRDPRYQRDPGFTRPTPDGGREI